MIILHWHDDAFTAEYAVKGNDYVALYDENFAETQRIINIVGEEWPHIQLDGEWTDPSEIPTTEEILRADVDFLSMENEYLEGESEQARADIDYLLMITEEE